VAQPKFTLYKHVKIDGKWKYFRAAVASNNKVKPHVVVVDGQEQKHEGGSYCVRHQNNWVDVGNDPAEALRQRTKLSESELGAQPIAVVAPATDGTPLKKAAEDYFSNLEARGCDPKTIRTYRAAVDPFVAFMAECKKTMVQEVVMRHLRKQPLKKRRHSNPNRTYYNKVSHAIIFLKAFGKEKLLKESEYPAFHKKKVVAHPEGELDVLYAHADPEDRFLLDFFIGTMARDHEAYGCRYSDLTGVTLTLVPRQNDDQPSNQQLANRAVTLLKSEAQYSQSFGEAQAGAAKSLISKSAGVLAHQRVKWPWLAKAMVCKGYRSRLHKCNDFNVYGLFGRDRAISYVANA
jgi:integrase